MLNLVVGHDTPVSLLRSHLQHPMASYIFHGPDGVGKRYTAERFFQEMSCSGSGGAECICKSCHQVRSGSHPDLRHVQPEGKTYGIAEVQTLLDDAMDYPNSAPCKLYIFDNAAVMTPNAASSFLKVLEDNPPKTSFVFLVESKTDLLPTIQSRSVGVRFSRLPAEVVREFLTRFSDDAENVRLCANLSGGSIGAALRYLRSGDLAVRDNAIELLLTLKRKPPHQIMGAVENEEDVELLFYLLRLLFADLAKVRAGLEGNVANFDRLDDLRRISAELGEGAVVKGIQGMNRLYERLPRIKATFPSHLKSTLLNTYKAAHAAGSVQD